MLPALPADVVFRGQELLKAGRLAVPREAIRRLVELGAQPVGTRPAFRNLVPYGFAAKPPSPSSSEIIRAVADNRTLPTHAFPAFGGNVSLLADALGTPRIRANGTTAPGLGVTWCDYQETWCDYQDLLEYLYSGAALS